MACSEPATRDSSVATSTRMPAITAPWKSSCGPSRLTSSAWSPSSCLETVSASWPVVSEQYSHVLTTAHTLCCCATSRLTEGGSEGSAGCEMGGSCSWTLRA
eukprot:scaffold29509_cov60-Phaeocystis_antarctica.AAC.1